MSLRVLLCTAHFGDGHQKVAAALRDEYVNLGCTVEELDCLRDAHPALSQLSESVFAGLTRYAPAVYGWSHEWTRHLSNESWFWKALSRGPRAAAQQAIARFKPDIVLQLFPEQTLANLGQPTSTATAKFVSGVVLTDYSLHSRWFCPDVDVYYLPHDSFLSAARRFVRRPQSATFAALGIPIRRQFASDSLTDSSPRSLRSLETNHKRDQIIVATGARGVFPELERVLEALLRSSSRQRIQVMCGRNRAMFQRVQAFAGRSAQTERIVPLEFVENVSDYLFQAAYAVVKPGGVTVAECLACGSPMLFYQPGAGQEQDNARFVERFGAGKLATDIASLTAAATAFENPEYLAETRLSVAALAQPNSARRVAEDSIRRAQATRAT